jgi:hypothetical protein
MPYVSKISLRQSNFFKVCFFFSVPLLLLVSCSSTAPTPTPAPQPQPEPANIVCADAGIQIGPTYPVPQTNSICAGNSLTWNHNNGHGGQLQDFIITFTPPTSTPFPNMPPTSTNGVLVSGAAVQPNGTNGNYTYSITFTGNNPPAPIPNVHVVVQGLHPKP